MVNSMVLVMLMDANRPRTRSYQQVAEILDYRDWHTIRFTISESAARAFPPPDDFSHHITYGGQEMIS